MDHDTDFQLYLESSKLNILIFKKKIDNKKANCHEIIFLSLLNLPFWILIYSQTYL